MVDVGPLSVQCDAGGSADSKSLRTTLIEKEWEKQQTWTRTHACNGKTNNFLSPRSTSLCLPFSSIARRLGAMDGRLAVTYTDRNKINKTFQHIQFGKCMLPSSSDLLTFIYTYFLASLTRLNRLQA